MSRIPKRLLSTFLAFGLALFQLPAAALATPSLSVQTYPNDAASINGTQYSSVQAAFMAAQPGDTIQLVYDSTDQRTQVPNPVVVPTSCTLDTNGMGLCQVGHGVSPNYQSYQYMFIVNEGVTFTFTNSNTAAGEAFIDQPGYVFYSGSVIDAQNLVDDPTARAAIQATSSWGNVKVKHGRFCDALVENTTSKLRPAIEVTGGEYDPLGLASLSYPGVTIPSTYDLQTTSSYNSTYGKVVPKIPVATVGSVTCYSGTDIKNALATAPTGTTVTILANFSLDIPLVISSGTFTLNLNGHTITCVGNGSLSTRSITTDGCIVLESGCKLTLANGTLATATSDPSVIVKTGSELTLGSTPAPIKLTSTGTAEAIRLEGGTLLASGGEVSAASDAVLVNEGTAAISGTKLESSGANALRVADAHKGTASVTGTAELKAAKAITVNNAGSALAKPSVTVSGGTVSGALSSDRTSDLSIWGGTFDSAARANLSSFLAPNATVDANGKVTAQVSDLKDATVVLAIPESGYTYDGKAKTPTVSVGLGGAVLTEGADYVVTYQNNTNAGTAKAIVTGMGLYTGSNEKQFAIARADISSASVSPLQDPLPVSDTSELNPTMVVVLGGTTLVAGTDYSAAFAVAADEQSVTATITGAGNYQGTVTKEFRLARVSQTYTVRFISDITNQIIAEVSVEAGKAATAPTPPDHVGYRFVGWNGSFDNVTSDLQIRALYEKYEIGVPIYPGANDTATGTTFSGENGGVLVKLTDADGNPATGWQLVGGKWYYGDADGTAKTGYLQDGDTQYYLKSDGTMHTGWIIGEDGTRGLYCFKHSGAIAKGCWFHEADIWYYADANGNRLTGWQYIDGSWYFFESDTAIPGAMKTGWIWDGGAWYWCCESGEMLHDQFVLVDGLWYWLTGSGAMLSNSWQQDSGWWYYFGDDGAMYSNRMTPDGYWVDGQGHWV